MIEPISDGKLFYKHHEINKISDKEASRIRREELGFIFQEFFLMPSLNAIENVMLPLFLSKSANDNGKSKAKELMKNFEVDALADKTPDELSITVLLNSLLISCNALITICPDFESKLPVGSSANII